MARVWDESKVNRDELGRFDDEPGGWLQRISDRMRTGRPELDDGEPFAEWRPGRWREDTPAHQRARLVDETRRSLDSDDYRPGGQHWAWRSALTDAELEGLIQEQADMMMPPRQIHVEYRNGNYALRVPVGREGEFPLDGMLATIDELASRSPAPGARTFTIAEKDPEDRPGHSAYTTAGGNAMVFNPRTFDPAEDERLRSDTPSAKLVPHYVWVMAHEYGHTMYPSTHEDTGPIWEVANEAAKLDSSGSGIDFTAAIRGPHEIFAEAFAEWFVSPNGSNVYARLFAERFGW